MCACELREIVPVGKITRFCEFWEPGWDSNLPISFIGQLFRCVCWATKHYFLKSHISGYFVNLSLKFVRTQRFW